METTKYRRNLTMRFTRSRRRRVFKWKIDRGGVVAAPQYGPLYPQQQFLRIPVQEICVNQPNRR
jgi:hypothetical protein